MLKESGESVALKSCSSAELSSTIKILNSLGIVFLQLRLLVCIKDTISFFSLKKSSRYTVNLSLEALHCAAKEAMAKAIAPYSHFHVGAALKSKSGIIYSGHNIEVSSYSLTICAERVALFKALSEGEREFESIVITASSGEFCPPCGACRQVLMDFAPSLIVYLADKNGQFKSYSIAELLPESFSQKNLDHLSLHDCAKTSRQARQRKSTRRKN
jgi:cytidine deaminase